MPKRNMGVGGVVLIDNVGEIITNGGKGGDLGIKRVKKSEFCGKRSGIRLNKLKRDDLVCE